MRVDIFIDALANDWELSFEFMDEKAGLSGRYTTF